jgi:hypothetical protein
MVNILMTHKAIIVHHNLYSTFHTRGDCRKLQNISWNYLHICFQYSNVQFHSKTRRRSVLKKGNRFKRTLCIMAGFVLVAVFSQVILARPVSADTVKELQEQIESYNGRGLEASVNGNTITVTGVTRNASEGLYLNLDSDITIEWKAEISGNIPAAGRNTLEIRGHSAKFQVMQGALIENKASDGTALDIGDSVRLYLSGGALKGYIALNPRTYNSSIYSDGNATILFFTGDYPIHDAIAGKYRDLRGIVFEYQDGRVYGTTTLAQSLTIPEGYTLTIPSGASLDNKGRIINNGKIVNNGTLTGRPVEGNPIEGGGGGGNGGGNDGGVSGCNAGAGIAGLCALALWLARSRAKKILR